VAASGCAQAARKKSPFAVNAHKSLIGVGGNAAPFGRFRASGFSGKNRTGGARHDISLTSSRSAQRCGDPGPPDWIAAPLRGSQ
jgi:hypothetical protein